jgi:hypothetical protein
MIERDGRRQRCHPRAPISGLPEIGILGAQAGNGRLAAGHPVTIDAESEARPPYASGDAYRIAPFRGR